jgi:hypothetical protein
MKKPRVPNSTVTTEPGFIDKCDPLPSALRDSIAIKRSFNFV